MIVVLNEWIFHDLLGENGESSQRETAEFLNVLYASRDRLVLPAEPRWMEKAYRLLSMGDATLRNTCRQFHALVLDSRRAIDVRLLEPADVPDRPAVPEDDRYLVTAYVTANADALVTTDEELCEALVGSCKLRDEFLDCYLG